MRSINVNVLTRRLKPYDQPLKAIRQGDAVSRASEVRTRRAALAPLSCNQLYLPIELPEVPLPEGEPEFMEPVAPMPVDPAPLIPLLPGEATVPLPEAPALVLPFILSIFLLASVLLDTPALALTLPLGFVIPVLPDAPTPVLTPAPLPVAPLLVLPAAPADVWANADPANATANTGMVINK
jgi:hypothetical protein